MIYKIAIENFFSIADEQKLVFELPRNAPDLPCFKVSPVNEDIRLPLVLGFFGPNASGKSTILRAIVSSAAFAGHSFDWAGQGIDNFFQPYRQKKWWGQPTKISLEFDGKLSQDALPTLFRYELHIAHQAEELSGKVVAYESLSYAPKGKFRNLFERRGQEFHFGQEFGISNTNDPRKDSIRTNASVISTLVKLNHPLSIYLMQQIGVVHTNYISVHRVQLSAAQWLSIYAKDKLCLDRLNRELRRFDVGLESMNIEQGPQGYFAKFKHLGLDGFIFLDEESSGTKRFIEVFPHIHYALESGGVVVIDELDADLHPLLLPELFRWFSDPARNPKGAQLFFTAHNPALLSDLEKEQIFFTEKPSSQPSQVYGARDIKGLRREPNLTKKYLSGELGAVPHVG